MKLGSYWDRGIVGKRAKKGEVVTIELQGWLALRWRVAGKRYMLRLGIRDSKLSRATAEMKARIIERDILSDNFDPTLAKYRPAPAVEPESEAADPNILEIWDRYIEARSQNKSPATIRQYGWVRNHLERCPHQKLSDAPRLFDWMGKNVPANSRQRVLMQISAACTWARDRGDIDANPYQGMAKKVKVVKRGSNQEEVRPFTREERDRIIATFRQDYPHYAPLVEFLFYTGCRPSEAIALEWQHVGKSEIVFEQAMIYDGHRPTLKQGLKTQQSRRVPLNSRIRGLLAEIRPEQARPEGIVFVSPKGLRVDWHNFTTRQWRRVLDSLQDIEYRNPYQARHTFISLCRAQNISSVDIAAWVGNSAAIVDRVYAKPVEERELPDV